MSRSSTAVRVVNSRTAEEWAGIIRGKWQDNVKSIFETALMLETAREELKEEFPRMYRDELKWSRGMVSQMLTIAECPHFADVYHGKLPASWRTLYGLAKLSADEFERGLESGVIHAGMERKDIKILKPPKEKPEPRPPEQLRGTELIERRTIETRKVIATALREMEPTEQEEFISLLRLQLDDIEARRAGAAA